MVHNQNCYFKHLLSILSMSHTHVVWNEANKVGDSRKQWALCWTGQFMCFLEEGVIIQLSPAVKGFFKRS